MQQEYADTTPDAGLFNLGVILGQNLAFGLVSGRCSAAQVEALQRIRQERRYKSCTSSWREFCTEFLNISGAEADRYIRLYQEFGAPYFEMAQLIRISAPTFRLIEPSLKNGALHHRGEVIELRPENCREVATAVAEIRSASRKPIRPLTIHDRIQSLDRRCTTLLAEFEDLSHQRTRGEDRLQFASLLTRMRSALAQLELAA
jgi:hypothetical protein